MLSAMMADGSRTYTSPLRAEQAAATRDRIIDAAIELLQGDDPGAIGMQDVADHAGVSVRTVYRSFPTKDDLITGVHDTIKERFERTAGTPPTTREELHASTPHAVRAVYELEPLYRALFATAAGRESHRSTAGARSASVEGAFVEGLEELDERQRKLVTSMLYLVTSSRSVLWLKDYAGLDVDEAASAVAWALTTLADAAREGRKP
jgi:AcrR family transcriptional regulator